MATQNILYLEDETEMVRRTTPPTPAVTLHAPAHYIESAAERDDRIRQQKLNDDDFKKRDGKFDEYKDKLAIDYPKGTAAHYHFLSRAIITDLDRWIENLSPGTTDVAVQYRAMVKRLLDRWGPTSEKDAEESRRKFASIAVDTFGADVFLAAADTIVDNLAKTLVRDTANNPVMEPVPLRPHLPRPHWHSPRAELAAYIQADEAAQAAWELQHPSNRPMNHRPTDNAIKNTIILALSQSSFTAYSSLAQRYQQVDHATKTWPDLRQDIESLIHNNPKGTSREPHSLPRTTNPRSSTPDWTHRRAPYSAPADSRSARPVHDRYTDFGPAHDDRHEFNQYADYYNSNHYTTSPPSHLHNEIRAAATTSPPSALQQQRYPCANCGADHKSMDCDSLKCSTCQATFPTAALRQAHYLAHHKRDNPHKRTRFADPNQQRSRQTPPSSPFLSRSARSMDDQTADSPYDSGYNSEYSTASGPGNPPPPNSDNYPDVSDQADQMIYNAFVATIVTNTDTTPTTATPPTHPRNYGPQSAHDAVTSRRLLQDIHTQLSFTTLMPNEHFLHHHMATHTTNERTLHQLQSSARMNYYMRNHPDLPTAQSTSSSSSANADDIPDLISVFHDDSAPEDHSTFDADDLALIDVTNNSPSADGPSPSDDEAEAHTPPLVEDSSDDDDDYDDLPPLMDPSDDSDQEDDNPPDHPYRLTDDELNRRRRNAIQRTAPIHLPHPNGTTYDIRLATANSDSEHSSDEDAPDQSTSPRYWPIAEDHQPPPPADPSDAQIQAWINSNVPWTTFRHRLPILQCLAYGHRPPPAITRHDPNRSYMIDNSDESIDSIPLRERFSAFRNSGHPTWTSYLNTLSTRIRNFYLDHPPNQADFQPTAVSALHVPDYNDNGTQAPYYEPKDPALPHPDDHAPTRLGGYTSTSRHISDVIHQQRGRSILSTSSRTQPETSAPTSSNQESRPHSSNPNSHHTPPSIKPPPGSDSVPPGTARLRDILTNLRTQQKQPPPTINNATRPEGYYTGQGPAHSSDSDNDPHRPGLSEDARIQAWIASQLPWSQYREQLPTHQRIAYGDSFPPHVVRLEPNQQYLWANHHNSIDSLSPANRLADFYSSHISTWTEYLKTQPSHIRKAYWDHPPTPCDYHQQAKSRSPDITHTPIAAPKDPARAYPEDEGHPKQPPAQHTRRNTCSEGYQGQPRHPTALKHRKRFNLPQASTPTTTNQAAPSRPRSNLTTKTARATAPPPTRDPPGTEEEVTVRSAAPYNPYSITSATHPSRRSPPHHAPPPEPKRRRTAQDHAPPQRPYISTVINSDEEGEPWCDCCTAQLSDSDPTPALIDPSVPKTRYRIRQDADQPPTHSNQHLDYMDIFRANADFNRRQRQTWERSEARDGSQLRTRNLHTSTYMNTPAVSDLSFTIARRQFERYQRRGGRLLEGDHTTDHRFNSPTRHNMTPGMPYREWFHRTISRHHYSLGEATRHYNQWLNDPVYGPARDRDHNQNPYLPRANPRAPPHPPTPNPHQRNPHLTAQTTP